LETLRPRSVYGVRNERTVAMKLRAMATVSVLTLTAAACSDGGVSAGDFVNDVDAVCGTLAADLSDLAQPAAAAEVAGYASSAASLYRDAIADLNRLSVPSGAAPAVVDAKSFVANLGQQAGLLDDIAASAGLDQAAADAAIASFEGLATTNDGLADNIGAERCVLDPLFAELPPPVTTVPVTTVPVTTVPITSPPVTDPPATDPPVTDSDKVVVTIAGDLTPTGVYTFADAAPDLTDTYVTILSIAPSTIFEAGTVSGTEVFDGGALPIARIFVFLPKNPLGPESVTDVASLLSGGGALTPATFGSLTGQTVNTDTGVFFIGSNDPTNVGFIVWGVAPSIETLDFAIQGFLAGL
jgi:hypothetical protein